MTEYSELRELDAPYLLCKALWGHDWDVNPTPDRIDSDLARGSYRILALRCTRCHRERYDYITRSGGLNYRYYKNPVDYPRTHRHTGDELRAELIRRNLLVQRYTKNGK